MGFWEKLFGCRGKQEIRPSAEQSVTTIDEKPVPESAEPVQMAGEMPGSGKCDIDESQSETKSLREKIIEDAQNYVIVQKKDPEGNKKYIESFEVFIKVLKNQDALEMTPSSVLSAYIYEMGYDPYEASKISREILAEAKRKYVLIDPKEIKKQ